MTFYLVGLGLDKKSISADALEILKSCDKIYLESYTVDFPYDIKDLQKFLGIELETLQRSNVEDESILSTANEEEVALLIYGDCLSATTHIQLILECKKRKIPYRIFNNSSIMTAVARTGLQLYKFGKTASMPNWKEHTNKPNSFMNYIKDNLSTGAHTLLLTDIGLDFKSAINQLRESSEKESIKVEKIIVTSNAGTDTQRIYFDSLDNLSEKKVELPFCIIIPTKLHFIEEEALQELTE